MTDYRSHSTAIGDREPSILLVGFFSVKSTRKRGEPCRQEPHVLWRHRLCGANKRYLGFRHKSGPCSHQSGHNPSAEGFGHILGLLE
jgi:hypothetical protein